MYIVLTLLLITTELIALITIPSYWLTNNESKKIIKDMNSCGVKSEI